MTKPERREPDFRLLVESVEDYAIYALDPAGIITSWNRGAERIKGYTSGEIIGQHFSRFYPDDAGPRDTLTAVALAHAARDGRFEDEGLRVRKDGTRFWASVVLTAMRGPDGTLLGFAKLTRDQTERRREQLALQEAEQRLRIVVDQSPIGLAILGRDMRYQRVNQALARLLGYSEEELLGKTPADVSHPDDRTEDARQIELLLRGAVDSYERVKRYVRKNGSSIEVHLSAASIRDTAGEVVYYVGQVQDLSEQRRADAAIRELQAQVQRQAEIYATMLGNMPRGAVFLVDADLRYLSAHGPSVEDAFGKSASTLVGRFVHEVAGNDTRDQTISIFRQTLAGNAIHFEAPRGGRFFEVRTAPVYSGAAQPVAALAFVYDVTEHKQREVALQQATAALEHSLLEKETLLKEIHHRVKNNLQVVGSIVSLHARRTDDEHVRSVFDEVRGRIHAISLLHEHLYRSRDLGNIDLADYIDVLVSDAARAAGFGPANVKVTSPRVHVDVDTAVPVGLIVNELVTNAFKHGVRGNGGRGTVTVAVAVHAEECTLTISDDGPGFPPDFETKKTKTLGMFLVQTLAKQLRGNVRFARDTHTRGVVTVPMPSTAAGDVRGAAR